MHFVCFFVQLLEIISPQIRKNVAKKTGSGQGKHTLQVFSFFDLSVTHLKSTLLEVVL